MHRLVIRLAAAWLAAIPVLAQPPEPARQPLLRAVDLAVGESATVELCDGTRATVRLLDVRESRDAIRAAIRSAEADVEVNGERLTLGSGNYRLPVSVAGVRIDCPVTHGYRTNAESDVWGLEKDARLRLWPAQSPLQEPGTFRYPLKQRWFASATQMANEPVYVDGVERPSLRKIYYHYGLDMGGPEGLAEVTAATDGQVVSRGTDRLPGYEDTPVAPRYDVVYLLDNQGWYYRYSHLMTIDPAVKLGATVRLGQPIGVLGKEGGSGGWSHLHFDIFSRQPSGKWGVQEGYALLWEAYVAEHAPPLIAVARPHQLAAVGDDVVLDGSRSWSAAREIVRYEWTCTDGTTATGPVVHRRYDRPGCYSEILKVVDAAGATDYDFAVVQILDPAQLDTLPASIHPAYAPSFGVRPGDEVTFKVRSFGTTHGEESWDFGDGSPAVTTRSDGNVEQHAKDGYAVTKHRYEKPGHYLVRVERTDAHGYKATARLHVRVAEK